MTYSYRILRESEKIRIFTYQASKLCHIYGENNILNFAYFAWARTPITSAYKSATMCIFPVLGPRYLVREKEEFSDEKTSCLDPNYEKYKKVSFS